MIIVLSLVGIWILSSFLFGSVIMGGTAICDKATETIYGGRPSQAIVGQILPGVRNDLRPLQKMMKLNDENYEITLAALTQIGFNDLYNSSRQITNISNSVAHKAGEDITVPGQEGFKLYVGPSNKKNIKDDYMLILYYEKKTGKLANIYVNAWRNHETGGIDGRQELGLNLYKYGRVKGTLNDLEITDSVIQELRKKSKHPDTQFVLVIDGYRGAQALSWDYATLQNDSVQLLK